MGRHIPILCALLGITACRSPELPAVLPPEPLRLCFYQDPTTFDPRCGGDLISSQIHFMLFEGLTRLNSDGSITPAQAERIDLSEDATIYTFHLRQTHWSNGDPVTAMDFERSWKALLDPSFAAPNAHLLYPIKNALAAKKGEVPLTEVGICAMNTHTLEVTLEKPTPYFLDLISFCVFSPAHIATSPTSVISNGPYQLSDWRRGHELLLHRNSLYWDTHRPLSSSLHISIIHHPSTALQLFEKGLLDVIGSAVSPLPLDSIPLLTQEGKLKKQSLPATTILYFNTQAFPFCNVHLRRAFSYAIQREEIVRHITQLGEPVANEILPPTLQTPCTREPLSNATLARQELEQGLRELGISCYDLSSLTYYYPSSDTHRQVAQAIQQQIFEHLGIAIHLATLESKVFLDKLIRRDFTLAQTMWMAQYHDPLSLLERLKFQSNPKNHPGWENSDYIALLDQSANSSSTERLEILAQAETLLLQEMPLTPIYHWEQAYLIQPPLDHLMLSPIGDLCSPH